MTAASIERSRFGTHDPDEGEDYIRRMFVDSRFRIRGSAAEFSFFSDVFLIGDVIVGGTRTSIPASLETDVGVDRLTVFSSRTPVRVGPSDQPRPLGGGDAMCLPIGVPYRCDWDNLESSLVSFAPELLEDAATAHLGVRTALRFDFTGPISPSAGDTWRRTCRLVRGVAAAQVGRTNIALFVDELSRLLATTALTCFANTTMAGTDPSPSRSTPESLRRAVSFIESNLDQPIHLDALALAARVSPRALNQTFNRHLGISPIGYVHRARLDAAHRDLTAAQPGDGQTVTAVAARWGFYDLPRFGASYRRAYGRPPSHALRNQEDSP